MAQFFDLNKVIRKLWQHQERIANEYGLEINDSPEDFKSKLLNVLDQKPIDNPLADNRVVTKQLLFEAAVKSLGSNGRRWGNFGNPDNLARLEKTLLNYDPVQVGQNWDEIHPNLRNYFQGGFSAERDIRAVGNWARKLGDCDIWKAIKGRAAIFQDLAKNHRVEDIDRYMPILLAAYFSCPPAEDQQYKFPGMGLPLAAEFLRNLGFSMFKPDRHIVRLLAEWVPHIRQEIVCNVEKISDNLMGLLRTQRTDLRNLVRCSVLAMKLTPKEYKYSTADNLLWALGAYVEHRRRREIDNYIITVIDGRL